jgi:signal transduction histidine kinase/DNA-binding NarL/FixJ family response regulator/HPt (histidine-containing phosphotransfer) domain-containing protein
LERLPEDFRELGQGLLYFAECVKETQTLARSLARGNLKIKLPLPSNNMVSPLKDLYASLKHLVWQTQQVASGDYTQRVSFMGDFANAFNTMIEQLDQQRSDLVRAKTAAEEASQSKTAFLATVSHEIRTPLNAIMGLSEIQLQKTLPDDIREDMEKIYSCASTLLNIVNDILDISSMETGNLEITDADFDVAALVSDTVQINIVRIGRKNISFELSIDETMPSALCGDELRLKQILNNLLSNAFKYTEKGKVTFEIAWRRVADSAALTFAISDTGVGIKREDMGKLFTEYSQLNTRADRNVEGTGLGLAITKHLVELMGGAITAESEYGVGSVFRVELALKIASDVPIGAQAADDLKNLSFMKNHKCRSKILARSYMPYGRVLIVDDVITNLDVAKGLMFPYGISIDCATSGREAIEKIRRVCGAGEKYDLVFMDHMMPGMDGIEATKIIRNDIDDEYARTVPIIAFTANAISGSEEMFLANGFNSFISKPIDIIKLDSALNKWIRDKQSAETLAMAEREGQNLSAAPDVSCGQALGGFQAEGIDLPGGISRYGEEAVYLQILRSFASNTPELLDKLRSPSPGELHDYVIAVHGLKGASLGICANELGHLAARLEALARARDFEAVQAENDFLLRTAYALLDKLNGLLQTVRDSSPATHKELMPRPDGALLQRMLDASKRSMTSVMEDTLAELEQYDYESGGEIVDWIREQIDSLEYRAIAQRLEGVDLTP